MTDDFERDLAAHLKRVSGLLDEALHRHEAGTLTDEERLMLRAVVEEVDALRALTDPANAEMVLSVLRLTRPELFAE